MRQHARHRFAVALTALMALAACGEEDPAEIAYKRLQADLDAVFAAAIARQAARTPKLRLNSWRCYEEHTYRHLAGTVTNISPTRLEHVTAVAIFETGAGSGEFVKTADALIDYQPLLPGQTSPFKVLTSGNPAISHCRLNFKHLFGTTIPVER